MFSLDAIDFEQIAQIVKDAAALFGNDEAAAHVKVKGRADYVTEVDTAVQRMLYEQLAALYPEIQFMGEEKDNSRIDFDRPVWILDPVDGTTNLIHRFPGSSISLALACGHELVAGLIYNPYLDELFFAKKGQGATRNGRAIHVSGAETLSQSLIATGTSPYRHEWADEVFGQIKAVYLRAQDIRRVGSAAMELAWVACGRLDGFFELTLSPWDFAAGLVILTEAGGKLTDYSGAPVDFTRKSQVLATNGRIHDEMVGVLGGEE